MVINMSEKGKDKLLAVMGLLLLVIGVVTLKTVGEPVGIMQYLPYICIGIGCGMFGGGMGNLSNRKILEQYPEAKKQKEIAEKDERNVAISDKAKAKAYDMMIVVFGVLMISFAIMGMEMAPILMLVCAYLFVVGYGIYYRVKYEKEM